MLGLIAALASLGALGYWLYGSNEELNPPLQAEWVGNYNKLEATLNKANPKVYNEDIAKAALIFSGAAYEKPSGFEGCLPDFKIKT